MANRLFDFSVEVEPLSKEKDAPSLSPVGQFLGHAIANAQRPTGGANTMKFFIWAKELLRGEDMKLILDDADVKALKEFVAESPLSIWVKGSIEEILDGGGEVVPKSGTAKKK